MGAMLSQIIRPGGWENGTGCLLHALLHIPLRPTLHRPPTASSINSDILFDLAYGPLTSHTKISKLARLNSTTRAYPIQQKRNL